MDCTSCGRANREGAKFCDACGNALTARAGDTEVRKVVTIVFADLIGSTSLQERLDPESVSRVMDHYYRAVRAPVEAHGGTVVQLLGDGVMCAFGVPRVAEDDAIRAVRAAVSMQRSFREFAREQSGVVGKVGLRVAVNTGEVVVSDDHAAGIGDPLNVAARLQQEAHDGDVLIGESTERLVRSLVTLEPLGAFALKGRSENVAAYRVVSLERPGGAPAIPFVGRDEELGRLTRVHGAAVAARRARLAVILGSPGLGKSRLLDELARRLGDRVTLLNARCDAAGGATFAPVAEALRSPLHGGDGTPLRPAIDAVAHGDESERARIAEGIAALLAGTPAAPEETFFVVRRFLRGLAAARPVMLALDDAQWAEPLLLDLIEHLVQWSTDAPLFVVVAARPELRDVRSGLAVPGGLVDDVVTLGGLDAGAATRLAANVIGADALPAAVAGRVLATSEGNPLFVGELVRMLVHDGALKREGERWVAGVEPAALEMPPTIHALLAARIERLRPEERTVLERAAVIGRHFSRTAVAALVPRDLGDLDGRLERLRQSELIEPDTGSFLGEPGLRFHHVLTRDAAYRRLLKGTRAELHGRFADWLEARAGETVDHEETIGWHLEQAHRHLRELGPIDERGRACGERAARHLAAAGRRALARDDLPLAASLLGRALDLLDDAHPTRADLALDWCEALLAIGDVGRAAGAIDELGRWAEGARDEGRGAREESERGSDLALPSPLDPRPSPLLRLRAWRTCFAGQLAALTDPRALRATAEAVAAAAEDLARAGDAAGEAKAHSVHATALARLGKIGACETALDRALAAARRAGDRRRANAVLAGAPIAALWGPSPVTRASGRCLDVIRVLRITQGAPAVEAVALRCQAVLEALRGRTDAARRMVAFSRRMLEELGITQRLLEADLFAGLIELLDEDPVAAERFLRPAYEGLRSHGLAIDAAQAAALLGRALLAQDGIAEAEALSHASETLAGDDLKAASAWRGLRAEALARRGEHAAAIDLARAAVEIAAATDALLDHASARRSLAETLRAAGRSNEADEEDARAIELWETKGATLLADRVRRETGRPMQAERGLEDRAATPGAGRRVRANAATACAARAEDLTSGHEPLAALGDSLALCRANISFGGIVQDEGERTGPANLDSILLLEVDAFGQRRRTEFFAIDRLHEALARLYERHAALLPEGPARDRAATMARSVGALLGTFDLTTYDTAIARDVEFVDHRTVGFPSGHGAEALLQSIGTLLEMANDVVTRVDDVLDSRPEALLVRWTTSGTDRTSNGLFQWQFLRLLVFGADGLLTRAEQFDLERDDEAFARLDQLAARSAEPFGNAATRVQAIWDRLWRERDWDAMVASFAPGFEMDDRRALTGLNIRGEEFFTNLRFLFDARSSRFHTELLATRGERLALFRSAFIGEIGAGGHFADEHLSLLEVDADARRAALVLFDRGDLDAAYAELDDRYAAGEAAPHGQMAVTLAFRRAFAVRDWDALATLLAPDLVVTDHRVLGWETLYGPAAYIDALRSLIDLAPDVRLRIDHVTMSDRGILYVPAWLGTREGGAFEAPSVIVSELDATGRFRRFDQYDLPQLDEARARFEELQPDQDRRPETKE